MTDSATVTATDLVRFSYAGDTGAYEGIVAAEIDPLDKNEIHEPANCTDLQPPKFTTGQIAVFDKTKKTWSVVSDYRGETWYDGSTPVFINKPGDPTTFTPALTKTSPALPVNDPSVLDLNVPPGLTLDQKKAKTNGAVLALINSTAAQFTKNYSQNEILSWTAKEAAARAYLAKQTLTDSQTNLLNSEYQAGGSVGTLDDLCNSIVAKADLLAKITGFLAGTRSEAQTQIASAQTDQDLLTIFNNTKAKITTQIATFTSQTTTSTTQPNSTQSASNTTTTTS